MIDFKIKIANKVFHILTNYPDTKELCQDYLVEGEADYEICISKQDIDYERKKSDSEAIYEGRVPEAFSEGYLESISVYRKIAEYMADIGSTVFHGSLIELDGEGYLFTGRSGIGKTTHISNWKKCFERLRIINGDKPILKINENEVVGYGTPWSGKENLNINDSVKIKAIIMVNRDSYNHIEKIELKECLNILLSQTYRSNKPDGIKQALLLAGELGKRVKLYNLFCNMEIDSAMVAYQGMNS